MYKNQSVNARQMACLFLAFMTGSSIINIPSPLSGAARNGAWISLLVSGAVGLMLLACVMYLYRRYPDATFMEYSGIVLGKWASVLWACLYLPYLIVMVSYIVFETGLFLNSTMMKETPHYVFNSLNVMICALTARAGIEVIARMFMLLLLLMLAFSFGTMIFVLPFYHPEYLLPVMPDGIKPILHGSYITFGFPYAEVILFSMLLPFARRDNSSSLRRMMFLALIANIVILTIATICALMALGPLAGELKYSLFKMARLISVQEFLERTESLIGISLIVGSYMKATLALYTLNLGLAHILKLKHDRILLFPLALIIFQLTLVMFAQEAQYIEKVLVVWPLYNFVAGVVPFLAVALADRLKSAFR